MYNRVFKFIKLEKEAYFLFVFDCFLRGMPSNFILRKPYWLPIDYSAGGSKLRQLWSKPVKVFLFLWHLLQRKFHKSSPRFSSLHSNNPSGKCYCTIRNSWTKQVWVNSSV